PSARWRGPGVGWVHVLRGGPRASFPSLIDRSVFETQHLGTTVVVNRQPLGVDDNGHIGPRGSPFPIPIVGPGLDLDGDGKSEVIFAVKDRAIENPVIDIDAAGSTFILKGSEDLPEVILSDIDCDDSGCRESADSIAYGLGLRVDGARWDERSGHQVFPLEDFDGD